MIGRTVKAEETREGEERSLVAHLMRLREVGITDTKLLCVVETFRHDHFVPTGHIHKAWGQRPLPIGCGQTMPSPVTTARLIAALNLTGNEAVLDVGTGTGYQAALLSRLARKVHSVERYGGLVDAAQRILRTLDLANITVAQSDGSKSAGRTGQGGQPLYDRIIVDSAFVETPRDLIDQLASGGVVVAVIGNPGEVQNVVRLTKVGSRFDRETLFPIRTTMLEPGVAIAL